MPPEKQHVLSWDAAKKQGPGPSQAYRGRQVQGQHTDAGALQKITVLESELLKLRAQIAMIVTTAPSSGSQSQRQVSSPSIGTHESFFNKPFLFCSLQVRWSHRIPRVGPPCLLPRHRLTRLHLAVPLPHHRLRRRRHFLQLQGPTPRRRLR